MSETKLNVAAPFDLSPIGSVPLSSESEIDSMLNTAKALADNPSAWIPKSERIAVLGRIKALMTRHADQLASLAAQEGGKPLVDSQVEVARAINGIDLAIQTLSTRDGEKIPMGVNAASSGRLAYTVHEPIGVVVGISAFNHPVNLIVHQVIPAFAAGCPVLIKPAMTTPLSCFRLVELFHEAGIPKDWCQVLQSENELAGKLCSDSRVSFVSFIGSSKVGWMIRSQLAAGAHCALEHGGAAPVIIEPDADIDNLIGPIAKGGFYHAGQVCVSVQRVFVHNDILNVVTDKLAEQAQKLVVGNPLDSKTEVGPLILPRENDRVSAWVQAAVNEGATLVTGGNKISETCYQPTVLLNPNDKSDVSQKEIFGPVVCLYGYNDAEKALTRANQLPFSFQGSVFTSNIDKAFALSTKLKANAVMINDHTAFRVDWMPFGGNQESGLGIGGIPYSIADMTKEKLIVFKSPSLS